MRRSEEVETPEGERCAAGGRPRRRRPSLTPVGLLLLAGLWGHQAAGLAADEVFRKPYTFRSSSGESVAAELGSLAVPENRRNPRSGEIHLVFLRFAATAAHPGPPLVYLAGGPGVSGIESVRGGRFAFFMALRQVGDLIALDQRGTGRSQPSLLCTDGWGLPFDQPGDPAGLLTLAREKAALCSRRLAAAGRDLAGYDVEQSAEDVLALRRALGAERVDLLGFSAGSRLALEVLRRDETAVRRAVLVGVEGPEHGLRLPAATEELLVEISRRVREQPGLAGAGTDLHALMGEVLARLAHHPVAVEVYDAVTASNRPLVIGPFDVQEVTVRLLDDRAGIARLPQLFLAMERGDFAAVAEEVVRLRKGSLGSAAAYVRPCASPVPAERWRRIQDEAPGTLLGRFLDFPFPDICDAWGVAPTALGVAAPVRSRVPALLISGTLDARTPVANAVEVAAGLPNASSLVLSGAGHGDDLLTSSPRILEEVLRFLRGQQPSTTRIELPPLEFTAGAHDGAPAGG
jgi:pimeloyl-ACP methyl ester carboxylesterase